MANEQWVGGSLDDGVEDVTFTRNECGEPEQHITKAAWIDELCEQGYWPVPHWECAGVSPMSFEAGDGFRFTEHELSFGGRLAGTVEVVTEIRSAGSAGL